MPAVAAPEATPDPVALVGDAAGGAGGSGRASSSTASAPSRCVRSTCAATGPRRRASFGEPRQNLWIRLKGPLPDDPAIHRAALVYLSDMTLIDTVLVAHGYSISRGQFQTASLDHAVWLHRPFRADDWLLYAQESPSAQGSRGLTRGLLYTRDGVLAATTTQEGLVRKRRPRPGA